MSYMNNIVVAQPSAPSYTIFEQNQKLEAQANEIYQRVAKDCIEIQNSYPAILKDRASITNLQKMELDCKVPSRSLFFVAIKVALVASCLLLPVAMSILFLDLAPVVISGVFNSPVIAMNLIVLLSSTLYGIFTSVKNHEAAENSRITQERFNSAIDADNETRLKLLALKKWIDRTDLSDIANHLDNAIADLKELNSPQFNDKINSLKKLKARILNFHDFKSWLDNELQPMPLLKNYLDINLQELSA